MQCGKIRMERKIEHIAKTHLLIKSNRKNWGTYGHPQSCKINSVYSLVDYFSVNLILIMPIN